MSFDEASSSQLVQCTFLISSNLLQKMFTASLCLACTGASGILQSLYERLLS